MNPRIAPVSAATYHAFVHRVPGRPAAVMIRAEDCPPCKKALPLWEELADACPGVRFGVFTLTREDALFVKDVLGVRAIPTCFVYLDGKQVFTGTGVSGVQEVADYFDGTSLP